MYLYWMVGRPHEFKVHPHLANWAITLDFRWERLSIV